MIIPKENTSFSINIVRILVKFMAQNGINLADPLEKAKIDSLMLNDAETRISTHRFYIIWKAVIQQKSFANMGLCLGHEIAGAYIKGNILFGMMANAGTLGKAIEIFCKYHLLSEDAFLPQKKIENDLACFSWETASHHFHFTRPIAEALLCAYVTILQTITDDNLKLLEVRFQHDKPLDIQEHEAVFKAPLRFNQQKNEIVIQKKFLDLSIFLSDPTLFQTLEQLAQTLLDQLYDSNIWTGKVLKLVGVAVARGERINIDSIASNLAVSPRNLQNKLTAENTTFQKILDQTRKEIALTYLYQKKTSLCDIALLLGFSEQSAFNHAFRRWTGSTPGQYRNSSL